MLKQPLNSIAFSLHYY